MAQLREHAQTRRERPGAGRAAAGSTLVLADDSYAAAVHAADHGWITAESLPSVRQEEKADEGETGTKADVPGVGKERPAPTIVVE